jgi:PAS domain S-box-containing protein
MALDDSQRKTVLAAIIDSSEDAIISKDLNGIITSWNKSAERIFGYREDEVIGKHISILIPADRLSEEDMIISNLRAGRRTEHFQTIRQTKDGRQLHISLTVSPVRDSKGVVVGASKIARDISAQKEAEELISKYVKQLEVLSDTGKTIGAHLDVDMILQKVTDATTRLSGAAFGAFFYNTTDAKGDAYMLYALSGAPKEAFEKFGMPRNTDVFSITFNGEGSFRSDDITKDPRYGKNAPHKGMPPGHLPVVSYLAVPVVSQSGIVIGGLFFGHPQPAMFKEEHEQLVTGIASQAAMALDNARLYEEVRALNAKKDEFIGFASHELKTPLTTIAGYLQLAETTPQRVNDFLPRISKQVSRLTAIISDLLDISKIHADRMELNFAPTSLHALIKESVETVRQLSGRNIESVLPHDDVVVVIDGQKMGQVLINILTNANKYSEPGTKIIITAIRLGDEIQITVEDQGIGISPKHIDKIFTQFYRVAKPGKSSTEGLGLGLYISREITEAHGGTIWAESEEGKGTTVHIHFPIEVLRKNK